MQIAAVIFHGILVAAMVSVQTVDGQSSFFQVPSPWVWTCNSAKECVKSAALDTPGGMSLAACRLTCQDSGALWPKPSTDPVLSKTLIPFRADKITMTISTIYPQVESMLKEAKDIFLNLVFNMESMGGSSGTCSAGANCGAVPYGAANHQINVEVSVTQDGVQLVTPTDESYRLSVETKDSVTTVYIIANTFFGARHAMETLTQLMAWDDLVNSLVIISDATINDKPAFAHRGVLIDSSRNFFGMTIMKRIIDGLSYNKLNVLHWHITDSHSFPFVSTREPLMAVYGAYTPKQVYRPQDIQELVHYGQVRGVKIIPELDAPSHVGAGWEWGPQYGLDDLILCHKIEPYENYCYEPPCGILDPQNENIYPILNNIYKDMAELFQSDIFHMGGDEVKYLCWNETEAVVDFMTANGWDRMTKTGFRNLWSHFQNRSLEELDKAYGKQQDVMLWTSDLTYEGRAPLYLNSSRYIIQVWEESKDLNTKDIIQQNFRLIMSNYDIMYLDCGYSAWIGNGMTNWCPPYKGWQLIYSNGPRQLTENLGLSYAEHGHKFIGGEAAMWTEQVEGVAIEGKLWPRLSALAERFWTDPTTSWKEAEPRFRVTRNRMVERGIAADAVQPQFCDQNDDSCFL